MAAVVRGGRRDGCREDGKWKWLPSFVIRGCHGDGKWRWLPSFYRRRRASFVAAVEMENCSWLPWFVVHGYRGLRLL
uniref:Uncharacterized protein n=1 Tax=Cucumis melo TaxID=3656 RepID=A0A9I9DAX0_CUCME